VAVHGHSNVRWDYGSGEVFTRGLPVLDREPWKTD
jgi:hypothetical protein